MYNLGLNEKLQWLATPLERVSLRDQTKNDPTSRLAFLEGLIHSE